MSKIADLRARTFENVVIGADQQIEFFRQRRDFVWIGAADSLVLASPNGDQFRLQLSQRPQAKPHLKHCDNGESDRQHCESDHKFIVNTLNLLFHIFDTGGDLHEIDAVIIDINDPFDNA